MAKHRRVHIADAIDRNPGKTFLVVLVVSILAVLINANPDLFGLTYNSFESEDAFLPETEIRDTLEDLDNNYGANVRYLQILVKGEDDNVLTKEALIDILEVEKEVAANAEVQEVLHPQPGNIASIASALASGILMNPPQNVPPEEITYEMMIATLEGLDLATIDEILARDRTR